MEDSEENIGVDIVAERVNYLSLAVDGQDRNGVH